MFFYNEQEDASSLSYSVDSQILSFSSTSQTLQATFSATGEGTETFTIVSDSDFFKVSTSSGSIEQGATLTIDITYVGNDNSQTGTITFLASGGSSITLQVNSSTWVSTPNLVSNPDQFNIGWTPNLATVSADVADAPDGTLTADSLIAGIETGGQVYIANVANINGTHTWSVYAKSETAANLLLIANIPGSYQKQATFDLSQGTFSYGVGNASNTDVRMVSVGDGWWKCSITPLDMAQFSGNVHFNIFVTPGSTPLTVGQSNIYIWRAGLQKA